MRTPLLIAAALSLLHAVAAGSKPPKALLINLPRHSARLESVKQQLDKEGVDYERAPAVDGALLTQAELDANVTALGRMFTTRGMMGCFLSHRSCWQRCVELGVPVLVFEDDVVLSDNFTKALTASLDELPNDWDVLLVGALGAVHPKYYWINLAHSIAAGGMRWPRWHSASVHTPLRPFGTHAYAISVAGARKLLEAAPRASYHVDVVAWGVRGVRLFAVHPLLAKQTHGDTTIGGAADRSWLPNLVVDEYTGTDFAWAWNAPILHLGAKRPNGGLLITAGRALSTALIGLLLYVFLGRPAVLYATLGYMGFFYFLLSLITWPQRAPQSQPQRTPAISV